MSEENKCYYCGNKATKTIEWKNDKVFSCDKCSEKATGKIIELGS